MRVYFCSLKLFLKLPNEALETDSQTLICIRYKNIHLQSFTPFLRRLIDKNLEAQRHWNRFSGLTTERDTHIRALKGKFI